MATDRRLNFSHVRTGQSVKVFMGAGWLGGTVTQKLPNAVLVALKTQKRTVAVRDSRNIK